ncbi:MAG: hypothetical protein KGQ40_15670 [Rhodospirillales bacterium]|nr:hypothetical protein [Rhodospirillales bacterium]
MAARSLVLAGGLIAVAAAPRPPPVREIGPARLAIASPQGPALVPLFADAGWRGAPVRAVRRAVIILHGYRRNAGDYYRLAAAARRKAGPDGAGTLLLAPQFLADEDIAPNRLPAAMLHWGHARWAGGAPAHGPAPLSAFDVLDALLARLADRGRFPALRQVVLAGHSAGAQMAQRYAVVGRGAAALARAGIGMRYVLANPGSYLYLTAARPRPVAACPGYDSWRYGLAGGLPPYVTDSPAALAARYAGRDVVYLLGTADTNPHHPLLDTSCAAEAQGATRLERGRAFVAAERARTGRAPAMHEVAGVGHNARRMLGSTCGLAALFDTQGCPAP